MSSPQPEPSPMTARPPTSPNGSVPPMPYPGTTTIAPPATGDETTPPTAASVPPMPSEVTNGRSHLPGSATVGRFRKMMRRTPRA
jgi:hypothetical protein